MIKCCHLTLSHEFIYNQITAMVSQQKLCGFIKINGTSCKCYKMKGVEYCKSHMNYDWGSEIEYDSEDDEDDDYLNMEYNFELLGAKQTIVKLEQCMRDMDKKLVDAQQTIGKIEENFEEVLNKLQQYNKNQNTLTFIHLFTCICLLFTLLYNVQPNEVRSIVYQLITYTSCYVDLYMTYSIKIFKHMYSYSLFNQNYKICFT